MNPVVRQIKCGQCGLEGHIPDTVTAPAVRCPQCQNSVPNPHLAGQAVPTPNGAGAAGGGHLLDEFFARLGDSAPLSSSIVSFPVGSVSFPMGGERQALYAPPPPTAPSPLPPLPEGPLPHNTDGERTWLNDERQRLETYMQKHFALLQQQREEFASWRTQVESGLIGREQELNRQAQQIKNHVDLCNERSAQLETEIANLETRRAQIEEETRQALADETARLAQTRREQAELDQALVHVRREYANLQQSLVAERATRQALDGEIAKRVAEVEARQKLLTAAELAVKKREDQARITEANIYNELEKQEQQLALERKQLEQGRQDLAVANADRALRRQQLAILSREVEHLSIRLASRLRPAPRSMPPQ